MFVNFESSSLVIGWHVFRRCILELREKSARLSYPSSYDRWYLYFRHLLPLHSLEEILQSSPFSTAMVTAQTVVRMKWQSRRTCFASIPVFFPDPSSNQMLQRKNYISQIPLHRRLSAMSRFFQLVSLLGIWIFFFSELSHTGGKAVLEKTPLAWVKSGWQGMTLCSTNVETVTSFQAIANMGPAVLWVPSIFGVAGETCWEGQFHRIAVKSALEAHSGAHSWSLPHPFHKRVTDCCHCLAVFNSLQPHGL